MPVYNEYEAALNRKRMAMEEQKDNTLDWHDLNRLAKVIDNFRPFDSGGANATTPKAAFRITMKDSKPVFAASQNAYPQNAVAGAVAPLVYTANNAGNRTAPYTYIKPPLAGSPQAGGAVFMPPAAGRKKSSFVDVIAWNNTLKNNAPGKRPLVIHPERQFIHWLRQQKAKDPDFIGRIKKINMRMAHVPCKTCTHAIANELGKIVGPAPKINIRVSDVKGNAGKSPAVKALNQHPAITVKPVAAGIPNHDVKSKVHHAIAERKIKQGAAPHTAAHKAAPHTAHAHAGAHPHAGAHAHAVKSKVHHSVAGRKVREGAAHPHGAHKAIHGKHTTGVHHPGIKHKVHHAIAARKMKQGVAMPGAAHMGRRRHAHGGIHNPVLQNKVHHAIAARNIKQGATLPGSGYYGTPGIASVCSGIIEQLIKNRVQQAIAERNIKQGITTGGTGTAPGGTGGAHAHSGIHAGSAHTARHRAHGHHGIRYAGTAHAGTHRPHAHHGIRHAGAAHPGKHKTHPHGVHTSAAHKAAGHKTHAHAIHNPALKSKVHHAIAERKMKQGVKPHSAEHKKALPKMPVSVHVAHERIAKLKHAQKEMEYEMP